MEDTHFPAVSVPTEPLSIFDVVLSRTTIFHSAAFASFVVHSYNGKTIMASGNKLIGRQVDLQHDP